MRRVIYRYANGYKYKGWAYDTQCAIDDAHSVDYKPIGFQITQRDQYTEDGDVTQSSYLYFLLDGDGVTSVNKSDFFEFIELERVA